MSPACTTVPCTVPVTELPRPTSTGPRGVSCLTGSRRLTRSISVRLRKLVGIVNWTKWAAGCGTNVPASPPTRSCQYPVLNTVQLEKGSGAPPARRPRRHARPSSRYATLSSSRTDRGHPPRDRARPRTRRRHRRAARGLAGRDRSGRPVRAPPAERRRLPGGSGSSQLPPAKPVRCHRRIRLDQLGHVCRQLDRRPTPAVHRSGVVVSGNDPFEADVPLDKVARPARFHDQRNGHAHINCPRLGVRAAVHHRQLRGHEPLASFAEVLMLHSGPIEQADDHRADRLFGDLHVFRVDHLNDVVVHRPIPTVSSTITGYVGTLASLLWASARTLGRLLRVASFHREYRPASGCPAAICVSRWRVVPR